MSQNVLLRRNKRIIPTVRAVIRKTGQIFTVLVFLVSLLGGNTMIVKADSSASVAAVPAQVVLTEPEGNIGDVSDPVYKWNAVANAEFYLLGLVDPTNNGYYSELLVATDICDASICSVAHSAILPSIAIIDGNYTWYVQAYDASGAGPWSEGMGFIIESAAGGLNTTITSKPVNPSTSPDASFQFTSTPAGATFECKLDSGAFTACTSPKAYTGLSEGSHTFQVRAVNGGETDPTPAAYTWVFSTSVPPAKAVLIQPKGNIGNVSDPTYEWNPVVDAEYYMLGLIDPEAAQYYSEWIAAADVCDATVCSALHSEILPLAAVIDGNYTWFVQASNSSGAGDWSDGMVFTIVSATAPDTSITNQPANPSNSASASFQFTSTPAGASFECKLDGGAFAACTSPKAYTGLDVGSHTFQVRAIKNGIADPTPASYTWTIDTTAPNTSLTSQPANPSNSANASFAFTSTEAGSNFDCKLDSGAFAACTSPKAYTGLSTGSHTFEVRARDAAGNVDASPASYTWMISMVPSAATLVSPNGNSGLNNPTYTWNVVPGATWYYLWVNGPAGNVHQQWYTSVEANCNATTCSISNATSRLTAGTYTWWIQTWNDAGYGPWSTEMTFNPLPGKATLTSPTGSLNQAAIYTWNAVPGATRYYLWVDGPAGNIHQQWYTSAQANCNATTCSISNATPALTAGTYKWWIQTSNDTGYGPWSEPMTFVPAVPAAVTLVSPNGNSGLNNPTYRWNAVPGATWYYLWVNDASGTLVFKQWYTSAQANCNATICSIGNVTPGLTAGTYKWWIQTWNDAGYGAWSTEMTFNPLPGKATLGSPNGTATNNPTYTWNAVPGATWYYLWIEDTSGTLVFKQWYTSAQANCNATTCSLSNVTPGLTARTYKWWIQTWNDTGYGPWSTGVNFTVP